MMMQQAFNDLLLNVTGQTRTTPTPSADLGSNTTVVNENTLNNNLLCKGLMQPAAQQHYFNDNSALTSSILKNNFFSNLVANDYLHNMDNNKENYNLNDGNKVFNNGSLLLSDQSSGSGSLSSSSLSVSSSSTASSPVSSSPLGLSNNLATLSRSSSTCSLLSSTISKHQNDLKSNTPAPGMLNPEFENNLSSPIGSNPSTTSNLSIVKNNSPSPAVNINNNVGISSFDIQVMMLQENQQQKQQFPFSISDSSFMSSCLLNDDLFMPNANPMKNNNNGFKTPIIKTPCSPSPSINNNSCRIQQNNHHHNQQQQLQHMTNDLNTQTNQSNLIKNFNTNQQLFPNSALNSGFDISNHSTFTNTNINTNATANPINKNNIDWNLLQNPERLAALQHQKDDMLQWMMAYSKDFWWNMNKLTELAIITNKQQQLSSALLNNNELSAVENNNKFNNIGNVGLSSAASSNINTNIHNNYNNNNNNINNNTQRVPRKIIGSHSNNNNAASNSLSSNATPPPALLTKFYSMQSNQSQSNNLNNNNNNNRIFGRVITNNRGFPQRAY